MIERVRAIVLTPANTILVIKRTRPGEAPYCVLPGGHIDETDDSLEDALRRELREELAGDATILRLVDVIYRETERQYFYLATMDTWSFADRTGPSSANQAGQDELEEISSRPEAVAAVAKPDEIAVFLASALSNPGGLAALPDRANGACAVGRQHQGRGDRRPDDDACRHKPVRDPGSGLPQGPPHDPGRIGGGRRDLRQPAAEDRAGHPPGHSWGLVIDRPHTGLDSSKSTDDMRSLAAG